MQLNERRLVSITDTCRVLGDIGRTTVYELIKRREIVKVNIGSRGFVTAESLEAYLEKLQRPDADTNEASDSLTPSPESGGALMEPSPAPPTPVDVLNSRVGKREISEPTLLNDARIVNQAETGQGRLS